MPVKMSYVSVLLFATQPFVGAVQSAVAQSVVAQGAAAKPENGSGKTVTVKHANARLSDVLGDIARQANLTLNYSKEVVPTGRLVTLEVTKVQPIVAFTSALRGTGLQAVQDPNGYVTIVRQSAVRAQAQGVVRGTVTDSKTGKGIAGANVSVGTESRRAVTGEDGTYRVSGVAVGTYTVSVRIVGYAKQTRTVTVGEGTTVAVDFKLEPSASVLDQVVVTGTVVATELKAVPSAITVVTAKQLEERGITHIDQLFRGEVPGLFALNTGTGSNTGIGGLSLDEVTMYSRGTTKISTSTTSAGASDITNTIKTYVDGVELSNYQYLSQIDPKSIERIEILTGPQASTIYGANAINGVMQIFTKRGSTVRPNVTLSLVEGFNQNNFSSALSPSHQYDGSVSGTEGKISYNVGSGWNYTGAWSPGKQIQRTNVYGGSRYQSGILSLDLSARQGWTQNKVQGAVQQVIISRVGQGKYTFNNGLTGLYPPVKFSILGRTVGATLGYTPFSWWSHQLNVGSDASDTQYLGSTPAYASGVFDSTYFNRMIPYVRISQTYSSTLGLPIASSIKGTLTYGADHWRIRTSTTSWSINPSGTLVEPSVTRSKPDKNSGVYLQGQLGIRDALFFTYGVRADWNPNFGKEAKVRPGRYGISFTRDIETPLGVMSAKLRGSYGRSIRPPAAGLIQGTILIPSTTGGLNNPSIYVNPGTDLYSTLPNPELGPEFQQGGEGGLELYMGSRASFVITRYNQTVDGLINSVITDSVRALQPGLGPTSATGCILGSVTDPASLPRSDGYCYYQQSKNLNIGSIRNQGWELQGSVNTGPFTTRGTYSWTKSRVIGVTPKYRALLTNQAFRPGQTFNFLPEHTWAVNVSYAQRATSVSLNVNGLGQTLRPASVTDLNLLGSSVRLRSQEASFVAISTVSIRLSQPGYVTSNLNASQRISEKVEALLQVTNLGNYYKNDFHYQYPTLGRQTFLGARIRWR